MILKVSLINWAYTAILTAGCLLFATPHYALSCFFAGSLVGLNLVAGIWSLEKLFQKKSVALAASVIVIKYAALLIAFITLYLVGWKIDFGFVIGLSALFPTLGFLTYKHLLKSETDGSL